MNLVFDFGGVLFRWEPHAILMRLLPHHAPDLDASHELAARFFERFGGDWGEFDRGTLAPGPLAERIAARTGLSLAEVGTVIEAIPHQLEPMADTLDLLERLQAHGHALYYLSNMPASYADHLEARHAFIGRFRGGVFSARVNMIKPEPAIFAHAVQAFGIDPADTVFIDDIEANAAAARAAGWRAVHFRDAAQCEEDLRLLGAL